jgi:hypothetical protein
MLHYKLSVEGQKDRVFVAKSYAYNYAKNTFTVGCVRVICRWELDNSITLFTSPLSHSGIIGTKSALRVKIGSITETLEEVTTNV